MVLSPLLGATEAALPFCTAFYAVKGDEVQYESSLVRCSPLENYACISVSVTYQIPVNYEITAVNVYLNDEPAQQLSQLSPGTYYGIFEIPQNGIETLKLVPVAKTSYAVDTITEELIDETLEWNVAFPAMQVQDKFLKKLLGGLIKWRDEKAISEVTDKYIEELMIKCTGSKQKARELSGGNQQKICLAKAFALEPKFLFVSEPTRGIDVGAKSLVLEALKKFNRESGVTVVMISSELEELRQVCDRIAIVSGGRIAGILPASDSSEDFGMLMVSQVK